MTSKIWERVEKTVVEIIGDWLDVHIRDFASRYRKRYLEHLIHRHRTFDVKGLSTQGIYSLEIEQVYVELSVDPRQVMDASPNPVAQGSTAGRHTIWSFFQSPQLSQQDFAILGPPGSGKTTLLKHITLGLAANNGDFKGVKRTPVFLFLRDHASGISERPASTIVDVVDESASKMGISAPAGWFRRELERGRCLIMLDGLDEVADPMLRKTLADWVEREMQVLGKNRFLITSRPFGYRTNPLSGMTVLEVRPFSTEQVERFVNNWYVANEVMSAQKNDEGVHIAAREGAGDLLRRLQTAPALSQLAVNPLLLTMITTVHRYRSSLPGRRVELYAEICDVFLGRRQQARGMDLELTPAQKKRVLQPLAFYMMCTQKREISASDAIRAVEESLALVTSTFTCETFLRMIENSSGLLIERENGIYAFAHLTFQEYLSASHILEEKLEDELVARVTIPWWHETIRLYCALADATRIVQACILGTSPSIAALTLATQCLDEARAVERSVREKVNATVVSGIEHKDWERRRLAAETKLALRLHRLLPLDEHRQLDASLISCAEYQLFVDECVQSSVCRQPDHWPGTLFPSGTGGHPVLGVRPSDAVEFCGWLTKRRPPEGLYTLPEADLGGLKGSYWINDRGRIRLNSRLIKVIDGRLVLERLESDLALLRGRVDDLNAAPPIGHRPQPSEVI